MGCVVTRMGYAERPGQLSQISVVDMRYEENRLNSFIRGKWKETHGDARALAKAGFFFYRKNQIVCYACNLVLTQWNPYLVPMDVHFAKTPHCKFVNGAADNVPISRDESTSISESVRIKRVTDQVNTEVMLTQIISSLLLLYFHIAQKRLSWI